MLEFAFILSVHHRIDAMASHSLLFQISTNFGRSKEIRKKHHLYSSAFLVRSTWFMNMFYLPSIHKLCALHKCIRPEIFEAEKLRFGRIFFLVRAFAQLNICQKKKTTQSCDEAKMHTFIEVYYVLFLMLLFFLASVLKHWLSCTTLKWICFRSLSVTLVANPESGAYQKRK